MNETDESYMREALHLAEFARGRTSPNPLVGALIVRDGTVVASGWHRAAGERGDALRDARAVCASGADGTLCQGGDRRRDHARRGGTP